jgi:CRISPR/Cas system CMR subunit Cmr4 (Cas7 group RAMP superfamily)
MTARLTFESASQVGAHESDYCDRTFARDIDGLPTLPGTSIAGALSQALADRLGGYRNGKGKPPAVIKLFGDLESHQSHLIVFDGVCVGLIPQAHVRDSVRICPTTGLAADGAKFDREILAPGLTFGLRFELICPTTTEEHGLLRSLATCLAALADGDIRFGAQKSRGLGCARAAQFRARRFDLQTATGWRAYAEMDHLDPTGNVTACDGPVAAIRAVLPEGTSLDLGVADARRSATIVAEFEIPGGLIVRSLGLTPDAADVAQVIEEDAAILPGTSIAGLLRHHVRRIANTRGETNAEAMIADLFGDAPRNGGKPTGSRVLVTESRSAAPRVLRQARVKIDRLTGGPVDTALFDESPVFGTAHSVTITVKNPTARDVELLLLAVRDIVDGALAVGGARSVGRGYARSGSVRVTLPGGGAALSLAADHVAIEAALTRMEKTL